MPDFWPIRFKGLHATCNAYVNDATRGTVLLSMVGSATVLNGLWAAFLSHDALSLPEGVVLRRILRRAMRYGRRLGLDRPFLHRLPPIVVEGFAGVYFAPAEIAAVGLNVSAVHEHEEERFGRTMS